MALFKQGETVVDMDSGQQFKIEDGDLELDEKRFGRVQGQLTSSPENMKKAAANARALPSAPTEMTPEQFTAARQAPAVADANRTSAMLAKNVLVPAAQAALAIGTGGMSIPAQMAIGAGGEYLLQEAGLAPKNMSQVALQGALPGVGKAVVAGVKGAYKSVGKFAAPAATRTAAGEAALERTGATGSMIDRAYETPGSKGLYAAAESQSPLSARSVAKTLKDAEASAPKSLSARPARRAIRETAENVLPAIKKPEVEAATHMEAFIANKQKATEQYIKALRARPSTVTWKQAIDEVQGLRQKANEAFDGGNHIAGQTLVDAADSLVSKMDKVSPVFQGANKAYNREQSINRVAEVFTKPGPSAKLGLLMQKDKMTKAAFSQDEAKMFEKIARYIDTIGATGSPYSGMGGRILDTVVTPIAAFMRSGPGMYMMKQTFKDGVTPQTMGAVLSFARAYNAQQEGQ